MVEELKLAIKIDDATIEQSLLKQFANAQKMADKVVLDFKNVNFDDKQIEAKFKEMQKKAGQNPIDLTIGGNTLDMLGQIDKRLTEIFSIGKGKSFIDSSSIATDIGKIENKINELNKKYEESQKKLSSIGSGGISGKDVNLVDNEEFKKLSQEVSELKNQFDDLKTHMQLLDDYTVPTDRFFELQSQVETTTVKVSDLVEEFAKLSNAQKALSSTPQESNISSGTKDAFPKTSENLEQVAQSEQKVQQEAVATDKALDNISFTPNTEGFDDIIAKFGILREQAEQITKIVKTTKQTTDGTPDISYKATLRNGSSYYLGENSTPQVLNASETVYDAKAVAKNAEQEAKAIQAEWDKNIKAIQDYMDAMTKFNNLKAKDKGTGSEANQIELQTQNVEKLKQVAWDARKNLSSMQAENPDIIAWKQWVDMMELFDQASKGSAESAAKLKDVLDNIKVPSLDKYENKLASYQTKKGAYNATIARFNDGGWTSDEYLKNVQAVKDAVKKYEDLLNNIKAKGGIASEDDVQNLKEYESEIKKTISTVTNMSAAEKGYNFVSGQKELDKIHKLLNENSKMSSEAKAKIKAYYKEIESGNPSMSLDRIHGEIMKIYNAEVEAGRAGRSFFDTLKNSGFHQLAAQMAGMFGFYDVINLGKQAFNTVKELDYALVDLKKTTAMNSSELEQFYYDSNDVAKQMGVTTKEIIDQASSWSRLGYNSKQAATEMAKLSSQFSLISPGMDTTTAQEGLVSIMKAWDIGYQDVKSQIMDDINALGNAMAEDNQDIVEGMERSAAALAAVGTSTKDAFALFSGIQEVLQNSEKSGTSLRSVALRLRSFDESTEEYSSDLANITGELADLTKTAEHAQGVSVFKPGSTTEFKNLVDYFREIADIWDEMSQKQQNDFLLKAFGRTQAQAGAALIQNFKGVEKALDVMDNAIGSSDKEMETAKQSITYKLNELKQTWVGTVQDIANRDDLGKIVDGLTDLSSAIGFVIDKLGLVGTIGLFGGAGTGIFKFIKNFDWVFKPYTKTLSNSFFSWSIIDKRIT
nr:MAG TPA: minor tail protein [Caudoviricetes sp.]